MRPVPISIASVSRLRVLRPSPGRCRAEAEASDPARSVGVKHQELVSSLTMWAAWACRRWHIDESNFQAIAVCARTAPSGPVTKVPGQRHSKHSRDKRICRPGSGS